MSVPLRVTVEVRVLDVGPRVDRAWRLSRDVAEDGLRLARALPYEANRPVAVSFRFPDGENAFACHGRIVAIEPERAERDGERAQPRAVRFTDVPPEARAQLARYLEERKRP
jgi:PilZ domain